MNKLAVIMPTFNQAKYLEEALDSLEGQNISLIVVDDGSTDETPAILERRKVRTMRIPTNGGTAAAINLGFKYVSLFKDTDWATWVSSDNIHSPDYAEQLLALGDDDVGVVYSSYERMGARAKATLQSTPYDPKRLITDENCYFGPSFMIRRDVWKRAGGHRGKISHDYDHWTRVEETCWEMGLRIVHHPRSLCQYRVHSERVTITRRHEYDARKWQAEAVERRALLRHGASAASTPGGG